MKAHTCTLAGSDTDDDDDCDACILHERNTLRKQVKELTIKLRQQAEASAAILNKKHEQLAAMTQERNKWRTGAREAQNNYVRVYGELSSEQAYSQQLREVLETCTEGAFRDNGFEVLRKDYDADLVREALALPHDTTALNRACKLYAAEAIKSAVKKWVGFGYWKSRTKVTQTEMVRADNMLAEAEQLRKEAGE